MNIVPARVEQQINRVDRTPSLVIGIICAVIAAWLCLISLVQLISVLMMFSGIGLFFGSLVPQFLLYGILGAVAVIGATGFLTRYAKRP
jgi:hypothetical protein